MTTNYTTAAGVQNFSITISGASTTGTATINSVGSGAFILAGGVNPSTANNPARDFAYLTKTSATVVTATRNSSTGTVVVNGCIIDGDTANLIKSVQYGTVTIAAAASSGTATVSAVTNANAAVHLTGWSSANTTYSAGQENPILTFSGTTVTATIAVGASGAGIVVGFVVIEFQGSALNQSVQNVAATHTGSTTSYTATFTSVVLANAITIYAGSSASVPTTDFAEIKQNGALTAVNTLTVDVNTGVALNILNYNCSVVEFVSGVLNSAVQRNTTTLTGVTSATSTLTTVNGTYSGLSWLANTSNTTATDINRAEGAASFRSVYDNILQNGDTVGASGSSYSITLAATKSGSLIAVGISGTISSITVTGVTDNKSQTYSQVSGARATDSGSNYFTDIWYFANSASGVTTITVSLSGSTASGGATAIEVVGINTTSPVDASAAVNNIASTSTPVSGNITTTQNNGLIFVVLSDNTGANSVASPYTLVNAQGVAAYNVAATPVTNQTTTFTLGGSTTSCISSAAFLSSGVQSSSVTVTKNNATGNITGSWEVFEFPAYVPPTPTFIAAWAYRSNLAFSGSPS